MNKFIFMMLATLMLSACGPASYTDYSASYNKLPPELKGCKVFMIESDNGRVMNVLHCDNKHVDSASYTSGKTQANTTVVTDNLFDNGEFTAILISGGSKTVNLDCKVVMNLPVCVEKVSK